MKLLSERQIENMWRGAVAYPMTLQNIRETIISSKAHPIDHPAIGRMLKDCQISDEEKAVIWDVLHEAYAQNVGVDANSIPAINGAVIPFAFGGAIQGGEPDNIWNAIAGQQMLYSDVPLQARQLFKLQLSVLKTVNTCNSQPTYQEKPMTAVTPGQLTEIDLANLANSIIAQSMVNTGVCFNVEQIARACHDANAEYCNLINDTPSLPWEQASDSAIKGVLFRVENPNSTPEQLHANWCKDKLDAGWAYGEVKDGEKRTHPCLVKYDELPKSQRAKDTLFQLVSSGMLRLMDAQNTEKAKSEKRTETLFKDGKTDARQATAPVASDDEEVSLFRKRYRQLTPDEMKLHDDIKDQADKLARLFLKVSPVHKEQDANHERGKSVSLAINHLEDAVYRAVRGLTS